MSGWLGREEAGKRTVDCYWRAWERVEQGRQRNQLRSRFLDALRPLSALSWEGRSSWLGVGACACEAPPARLDHARHQPPHHHNPTRQPVGSAGYPKRRRKE